MKKLIAAYLVALVPLSLFAQSKFTAPVQPPSGTVSQLPTASSWTYGMFWVTDGASSTDCTTGSGSTKVLCYSDGSAWTAVSSGGGGGTMFSTAGTGSFWPLGAPGYSASAPPINSANDVYYFEFVVPAGMTWRNVVGVEGAGDAGKHYAWAIYDSTCSLLKQTGTRTSSASTAYEMALASALTVTPGTYFMAYTSDSNIIAQTASFGSSPFSQMLNTDSTLRTFKGSNASTGTSTLTFPATCGTRSSPRYQEQFYVALLP